MLCSACLGRDDTSCLVSPKDKVSLPITPPFRRVDNVHRMFFFSAHSGTGSIIHVKNKATGSQPTGAVRLRREGRLLGWTVLLSRAANSIAAGTDR